MPLTLHPLPREKKKNRGRILVLSTDKTETRNKQNTHYTQQTEYTLQCERKLERAMK